MYQTTLRRVGGSTMLAIPQALSDALNFKPDTVVDLSVKDGNTLIVASNTKTRYSLKELLANCDPSAPLSQEDAEWVNSAAVGHEDI